MAEKIQRKHDSVRSIVSLRKGFFDAKGGLQREKMGSEIVKYATEERYDCLAIIEAVDIAYEAIATKKMKQEGLAILDGIKHYFDNVRVSTKLVFPTDMDIANSLERYNTLAAQYNDKIRVLRARGVEIPQVIINHLDKMTVALQGNPSNVKSLAVFTVSREQDMRLGVSYLEAEQARKDIMNMFIRDFAHNQDYHDRVVTTDQTLSRMNSNMAKEPDADLALNGIRYDGISMGQILDATDDPAVAGSLALRFIAAMPKGDYFWQRLTESVFCMVPLPDSRSPKDIYKNPRAIERIYNMQRWMAEKLIGPSIAEHVGEEMKLMHPDTFILDPEFDRILRMALENMDSHSYNEWGLAMYQSIGYYPLMAKMFHPEHSLSELSERYALSHLAVSYATSKSPKYMVMIDQAAFELVKDHWNQLVSHWQARFFNHSKKDMTFWTSIDDLRKGSFAENHTEFFLQYMMDNAGRTFMERLDKTAGDLDSVSDQIWYDSISYWPDKQMTQQIVFSESTLPEIIGFQGVYYRITPESSLPIEFTIQTKDQHMNIIGEMDEAGEIVSLSAEIGDSYPGMQALIRHIMHVSLHDLLVRQAVVVDGKSLTVSTGEKPKKEGQKKKKIPLTKKRAREMQRDFSLEQQTTPLVDKTVQGEIEEITRKTKQFVPRHVDMHPSSMDRDGFKLVKELIVQYAAQPERRRELLGQISGILEQIRQPSQEKIQALDQLPPRFKTDIGELISPEISDSEALKQLRSVLVNEKTQGPYYENTWVVAYVSPKLAKGQHPPLPKLFNEHYKTGPTLDFLDYLKTWIVLSSAEEETA